MALKTKRHRMELIAMETRRVFCQPKLSNKSQEVTCSHSVWQLSGCCLGHCLLRRIRRLTQ
jgi:hypothetical protein